MKDQENDLLELKLKTLTEILAGLSLAELFSVQEILSIYIRGKIADKIVMVLKSNMKDRENDLLELKLKTLAEILAGLSLPELVRVQEILGIYIIGKIADKEDKKTTGVKNDQQ